MYSVYSVDCCHLKSRALHPSRSKQSFRFAGIGDDLPSPGLLRRSRFLFFFRALFASPLCFFENFSLFFFYFFLDVSRDFARFPFTIVSSSPRSLPVDGSINPSSATARLFICVVSIWIDFYCFRAIFTYFFFFSANFKRNQQNAAQEAKDF